MRNEQISIRERECVCLQKSFSPYLHLPHSPTVPFACQNSEPAVHPDISALQLLPILR